ncbi:MAG: hypothetical protein K0U36_02935 [Alphaproteobacteria bacterium]|nr:hypothetical protein [Alphaproteobacteria bacterium]
MTTTITKLVTMLHGNLIGTDQSGNKYYIPRRAARRPVRQKRWVVYGHGCDQATVPPMWHAWLHHTADSPPSAQVDAVAAVPAPRGHAHVPAETYQAWRP